MNKTLTYHREGDYLLPDMIPPEAPQIGVWGSRRRAYLMKYRKPIYTGMLLNGTLNAHLEETDRAAEDLFFQLVDDMAKCQGITEQLKAENQMVWVGAMNNIRQAAEEIIRVNIINQ